MFSGKKLQSFSLAKNREVWDAAVILSIAAVASVVTIYVDGFRTFCEVARTDVDLHLDSVATGVLFFAVATAVFGVRRIVDQRQERTRRVLAERRARALALYDPLTRLPNRVHLEHELAAALKVHGSEGVTLLLLKLNGYRELNDLYGYAGGDSALAQVAARLRDRVGTLGLLARTGDDEFAICLGATKPEIGTRLAQALLQSLDDPVQIGVEEQKLEASIGVASSAGEDLSCDEMLRRTHVALYRAKGRDLDFCYFDAEMDAYMRERSLLGKELRAAVNTSSRSKCQKSLSRCTSCAQTIRQGSRNIGIDDLQISTVAVESQLHGRVAAIAIACQGSFTGALQHRKKTWLWFDG